MVKKLAFPIPGDHFKDLLFAVAINLKRPTRLDTRQHADQSLGNALVQSNVSGVFVLANLWRTRIFDRTSFGLRALQRGLNQLIGYRLGMFAKILQQHSSPREVGRHAPGKRKHPQRPTKDNTIPTAQLPGDVIRVF